MEEERNGWNKQRTFKEAKPSAPTVDESLIGKRIEYRCLFDMDDEGLVKKPRCCCGVIERLCDGSWIIPGHPRKRWKVAEAAEICWDAMPDANIDEPFRDKVEMNPKNWNKDCVGAWRMDLGDYDYGV